jgi:hypothetical protein
VGSHQQLNRVPIRHHVVTAGRHHSDDGMEQLSALIQPPDTPNDSNVRRHLVVSKDRFELLSDGGAAVHLTAVEADHESVLDEAVGVRLDVLSIPRVEDHTVQSDEIRGSA